MYHLNILHKIRITRLSKNWTQKRMAIKLGISIPTYSRFERGITKTNYSFLQKVCNVLDIDLKLTDNFKFEPKDNHLEEDEIPYKTKFNRPLAVSYEDVENLICLFEQQQKLSKAIIKKLKTLQLQD